MPQFARVATKRCTGACACVCSCVSVSNVFFCKFFFAASMCEVYVRCEHLEVGLAFCIPERIHSLFKECVEQLQARANTQTRVLTVLCIPRIAYCHVSSSRERACRKACKQRGKQRPPRPKSVAPLSWLGLHER